jgi:hypothetical protein
MQKAFIETQFPFARLSAESYKERKAVSGQLWPDWANGGGASP